MGAGCWPLAIGYWRLAWWRLAVGTHGKLRVARAYTNSMNLWNDLRFAIRSLSRTKGLTVTVIVTLALGIGANAAIFTLVRGVLLRPLVNRDENRLIYIRQSAPGMGVDNAAFSVPEIQDLRSRVKSFSEIGDFSTIGFTMVGLGEPREVRGGRGRRIVLRRDGTASGAGPAAGYARRRAGGGGRGGADLSILDYAAQERSVGAGEDASGWARARRRSSECWNRRCRIRPRPRLSPTW